MPPRKQKSRPTSEGMPFNAELGPRIGRGQDNVVFRLVEPQGKPKPTGQVLKINHRSADNRVERDSNDREAAMKGILYKKNKYDILKRFLGDFIPESSFVLGRVTEGYDQRYAEYTMQTELPQITLDKLTQEQKDSPVLKNQVVQLMDRLSWMYEVLGQVNARTAHGVSLDGKLDLGDISDYVRAESIDHDFDERDAQTIINSTKSPNLLVDPETLKLYCIDFDQGQWTSGMDQAKEMVFRIADHQEETGTAIANIAMKQAAEVYTLPFDDPAAAR